jgi:C1A family cysteine protease
MRFVLFFLCIAYSNSSLIERFENWITDFKITFDDYKTYDGVFHKWTANHKFIEEVNSKNLTYKLGHNQFSGMDSSDFSQYLGISRILYQDYKQLFHVNKPIDTVEKIPESINWVSVGAVTPVKDQGQCGSCWSFSTTGALEGAHYVKTGELESFSEQQLVDCDNYSHGGKDLGCKGGLMDNAFTWISKNNGLCREKDYPYVSGTTKKSGTCQETCIKNKNSDISSYVDVISSSDDEMMKALSLQPVSIAIQADEREFQLYKSGVFTGKCGNELDHGVLAVGYGKLDGLDYYLIKNSWSTSWGNGGYIMLGRGAQYNGGDGQCGMLLQASYPLL